jgi:hypothetical protein
LNLPIRFVLVESLLGSSFMDLGFNIFLSVYPLISSLGVC